MWKKSNQRHKKEHDARAVGLMFAQFAVRIVGSIIECFPLDHFFECFEAIQGRFGFDVEHEQEQEPEYEVDHQTERRTWKGYIGHELAVCRIPKPFHYKALEIQYDDWNGRCHDAT